MPKWKIKVILELLEQFKETLSTVELYENKRLLSLLATTETALNLKLEVAK